MGIGPDEKKKNKNPNYEEIKRSHNYNDLEIYVNEADVIPGMNQFIQTHTTGADNKTVEDSIKQNTKIHHAKGTADQKEGAHVLEFFCAGSGNDQWVKMYKNFTGYNEKRKFVKENPELQDLTTLSKIKYIEERGENPDQENIESEIAREYGNPLYINKNKQLKAFPGDDTRILTGVRKKEIPSEYGSTKTRFNFSGPMRMGGLSNAGDYSIENLQEYMYQLADDWLGNLQNELKIHPDEKPINIYFRGHSRGAVAANEASAMINYLIQDKYPMLADKVQIKALLYDPVPGTGSYEKHKSVDHSDVEFELNCGKTAKGLTSKGSNPENDNAVIYSIQSNYSVNFSPQTVLNTKKVILTGQSHCMGLYDIDNGHKRGYINAENKHEYRGSGIHDLDDGLYLLDEKNTAYKMHNRQESLSFLKNVYNDKAVKSRGAQKNRHKTMFDVVNTYFDAHPEMDVITEKDTRYHGKHGLEQDMEAIKNYVRNKDTLPNPEKERERIVASLISHAKVYSDVNNMAVSERVTDEAYNLAKNKSSAAAIEAFSKEKVFQEYIKTVKDEDITKLAEGGLEENLGRINLEVNKFNNHTAQYKSTPTAELINKNVIEDTVKLQDILIKERALTPEQRKDDKTVRGIEEEKRKAVAMIVSRKNLLDKASKKDLKNDAKFKKQYEKDSAYLEENISLFADSRDFKTFYNGLTKNEIRELATGSNKAVKDSADRFSAVQERLAAEKKAKMSSKKKTYSKDSFELNKQQFL